MPYELLFIHHLLIHQLLLSLSYLIKRLCIDFYFQLGYLEPIRLLELKVQLQLSYSHQGIKHEFIEKRSFSS